MSDTSFFMDCRSFVSRHQRVLVPMVAGAAFLCMLLGLALPNWIHVSYKVWTFLTIKINVGLWQACNPAGCDTLSTWVQTGWLDAGRAFMIIGFIGSIALVVCAGLFVWKDNCRDNQCFKKGFFICALGTGLCVLVAVMAIGIGVPHLNLTEYAVGAAFFISCGAIFASIAVGIAVLLLMHQVDQQTKTSSPTGDETNA